MDVSKSRNCRNSRGRSRSRDRGRRGRRGRGRRVVVSLGSRQSRWYCHELAGGGVLSSGAEDCGSPRGGVAALWLEAKVAAPVQ